MYNKVAIIGLGFVGLPMAVAIASSRNFSKVVGIEKSNKNGEKIIKEINSGILPIGSGDKNLDNNFKKVIQSNKFSATTNFSKIKSCDVVVVSINFDFYSKDSLLNIKSLFKKIQKNIKKNSLVILETTVPPGFSEKILYPILSKKNKKIFYGYSFERVTPGDNYYFSIINSTRVFSGIDSHSKKLTKNFLKKVINTRNFPLSEIDSISSCELTKVMENSYRALNIAFIDEWVNFSIKNKIDLNSAITEIKKRETHKNIMRPGLGVGGYCLTKDPLFIKYSSSNIFKCNNKFPFIDLLLKTNKKMEQTSFEFIKKFTKKNDRILLLGISYKEDVKDVRSSPSLKLKKILKKNRFYVETHDPFYDIKNINSVIIDKKINVVIFCVPHKSYKKLPLKFFDKSKIYFDLNMTLDKERLIILKKNKIKIHQLGS